MVRIIFARRRCDTSSSRMGAVYKDKRKVKVIGNLFGHESCAEANRAVCGCISRRDAIVPACV